MEKHYGVGATTQNDRMHHISTVWRLGDILRSAQLVDDAVTNQRSFQRQIWSVQILVSSFVRKWRTDRVFWICGRWFGCAVPVKKALLI